MSGWEPYIKSLLDGAACIKKAAIVSADNGSIWAKSEEPSLGQNFLASADELQTLATQFNNLKDVPSKGVVLEKLKYIVPNTEEQTIFGKKDSHGLIAVRTNQTIVIAIYEGDFERIAARMAVERIAKHLTDSGY